MYIPGANIVDAGTITTGNSVTRTDNSYGWAVAALSAAQYTVQLDDGLTVTIPSTQGGYVLIPGNYQKIKVTGATVAYFVLG